MHTVEKVRRQQDALFNEMGGVAPSLDQQREMAAEARRMELIYADLQQAMPEPGPTDSPQDYRVRLLVPLQKFSGEFRNAHLRRLALTGGLRGIDESIVRSATAVANDKTVGSFHKAGALRPIHRTDPGGEQHVSYYGNPLSWMRDFMSPIGLAVESFRKW
jgi:hypothetical protein